MRIRIFQPIVPEYRRALFEGLAKLYGDAIEVCASDRIGGDLSVPLDLMRYDYDHPFVFIGPFQWQRGMSLRGLLKGDVIVICGDIHVISTIWLAIKAKMRGVKVIWWGHHKSSTSTEFRVRIRLAIARFLSDIFLAYTRTGVEYLGSKGFRKGFVFATGNTIDQKPIRDAMANCSAPDPFHGKVGLLCCSVLREKVRLDLAIKAMADRKLENVVLAVIGDGPLKAKYEEIAKEYGVEERIIWVGETRDQHVMAPWFLNAKAFVYPGSVGLSILHAMSYGLPVVVHDNAEHQMPEYEVMENGRIGYCFREGDVNDLVEKVSLIISDERKRQFMSEECKRLAYNSYSMEAMVGNFSKAIEACR